MSTSDKISWVGGMMGLFTGFSVISGLEIIYWLWFKVLLHGKNEVAPEELKVEEDDKCGNCGNLLKEVMLLKNEVEEIKFKRKDSNHEKTDQSGAFFDAIFNDVEAQHSCDIQKQP